MSIPFSDRLRSAREDRKLKQQELAEKAGLPATTISHFESGSRKPSFDNLKRLATALDVSTDYLLGLAENAEAPAHAYRIARHLKNASDSDIATVEQFAEMLGNKKKE